MPSWLPTSKIGQMWGWLSARDCLGLALEPRLQLGVRGDMLGQIG